jgi:hypothetical protein
MNQNFPDRHWQEENNLHICGKAKCLSNNGEDRMTKIYKNKAPGHESLIFISKMSHSVIN